MSIPREERRRAREPRTFERTHRRARERAAGERDRDRVLYSSAFQRLGGVTQVMPAATSLTLHNRLTHSLKVAQVARRLAQQLAERHAELARELDPDSVEASALVHDLGHPPFGHIAERALDDFALSRNADGFEGNAQSFRIATRLAQRWPILENGDRFDEVGLNLTRRTLDGVLKYPWRHDAHDERRSRKWGAYCNDASAFEWVRKRRPEYQRAPAAGAMDWADDITYAVHDMDDFYRAGLVPLDRLCTSDRERSRFHDSFTDAHGNLNERLRDHDSAVLERAVSEIFDRIGVIDPYVGSRMQRQLLRGQSSFLIRYYMSAMTWRRGELVVDPVLRAEIAVLKELTWFYVINRPELAVVQDGQRSAIMGLAEHFWDAAVEWKLHLFPLFEQETLCHARTDADRARIVCDFIARLTEGRVLELHRRLNGASLPLLAPIAH